MKIKTSGIVLAAAIISVMLLMILPVPTFVIDTLLVFSITIAVIVMLMAIFTKDALEFSVFPTIILLVTFFRLSLNVSTTRAILFNQGDAGNVVETFAQFVTRGNFIIGIIVFLIILIIQFMVITKGAERVSEVSARFTLDALPGKQMSIDADLNAGAIDDAQAKVRRDRLQNEIDFHGAMDGASKFIKGDTTAGLVITVINIVAGLISGIVFNGMEPMVAVTVYTMATIGDGLVNQIPALLISTASGIIVTRSGTEKMLSDEIVGQVFAQPWVLVITGSIMFVFSLVPGMPGIQMWVIAITLITVGVIQLRNNKLALVTEEVDTIEEEAEEKRKPDNVTTLLQVHPIELELGYGIVPMVDVSQGGDLFDRIVMIRRQCALDLGILVPAIRLRDNIQLGMNTYSVKIKGVEVASGEVMSDHLLALAGGEVLEEIYGIPTVEPTFGQPALWIPKSEREKAELYGYSTVDPPSIIATHLTEIIKRYGHELLNRQQIQTLVDNLAETQPTLVEEVVPKMFSYGEIQKILANLLKENIPIRDMATIVETLGDYGGLTRDAELLTEYIRQNLRRMISKRFIPEDKAYVITLDAALEQLIAESTRQSEHGAYLTIDPAQLNVIFSKLRDLANNVREAGQIPLVLTSPLVRRQFRKIAEQVDLTVLSFNEVDAGVEVVSAGVLKL